MKPDVMVCRFQQERWRKPCSFIHLFEKLVYLAVPMLFMEIFQQRLWFDLVKQDLVTNNFKMI